MKLRTIPYGYAVQNGKNIPHPDESIIVRQIFTNYLGGASLQCIAQTLTDKGVEFLPGRFDWNKNRIKRILEDTRYLGTDTYPALAGEDMFHRAQAVKDSNNNQIKSEIPFRLPCPVECFCGAKMSRRHDGRRKASKELWTCQNTDCKQIININDDTLLANITELLNRLIADPSLIQAENPTEIDSPPEVRRLHNEVTRQLDSFDFDKEHVKTDIFSLAAEKYRQIDSQNQITQMLRAEFESQTPLSHFLPELFKRTVSKIQFNENGAASLILKNNQNIGREPDHADINHTGNTAASDAD